MKSEIKSKVEMIRELCIAGQPSLDRDLLESAEEIDHLIMARRHRLGMEVGEEDFEQRMAARAEIISLEYDYQAARLKATARWQAWRDEVSSLIISALSDISNQPVKEEYSSLRRELNTLRNMMNTRMTRYQRLTQKDLEF